MILFSNVTSTCSTNILSSHLQLVLLFLVIIEELNFFSRLNDSINWSPEYTSSNNKSGTEFQSHLQLVFNNSEKKKKLCSPEKLGKNMLNFGKMYTHFKFLYNLIYLNFINLMKL